MSMYTYSHPRVYARVRRCVKSRRFFLTPPTLRSLSEGSVRDFACPEEEKIVRSDDPGPSQDVLVVIQVLL